MLENAKPDHRQAQPSLSNKRILLVDENAKHLERISRLLVTSGYSVRAFTEYREAAKCLEQDQFDAIIVRPNEDCIRIAGGADVVVKL